MATLQTNPGKDRGPYWRAHISALAKSGLSRAEYCRQWNLSYHAMTYWQEKLSMARSTTSTLVPVSVPAVVCSRELQSDQSRLRLVLPNRFSIEIGDDFTPETLRSVLTVVEGR